MIIDSHAHYANSCYQGSFRYLTWQDGVYALEEGTLPKLMETMEQAGICYFLECAIGVDSNERVLQLCQTYPGKIFPAVGAHPTRVIRERWKSRKRLPEFAKRPGVAAIGETGLDYHYKREEQHRLRQHLWFFYQLDLAWRRKLPTVLHVRDAHSDALRILKHHPARKYGGVVHCFNGTWQEAEQYVKLGYHLGIGGSLLQPEERAGELWEAVRRIPMERILLETDAPYVLPYCKDTLPGKAVRRAKNSSLVLPRVAEKIGQLKGIAPEIVAQTAAENTIRLFDLPVERKEV